MPHMGGAREEAGSCRASGDKRLGSPAQPHKTFAASLNRGRAVAQAPPRESFAPPIPRFQCASESLLGFLDLSFHT